MIDDFETVRTWLPEEARTAAQEAYAALDRILARKHPGWKVDYEARITGLEAEVERLQGRIDKLLASPRRCDDCPGGEDYKTEVERLRARIAELEEENKNLNWQLDQEFKV